MKRITLGLCGLALLSATAEAQTIYLEPAGGCSNQALELAALKLRDEVNSVAVDPWILDCSTVPPGGEFGLVVEVDPSYQPALPDPGGHFSNTSFEIIGGTVAPLGYAVIHSRTVQGALEGIHYLRLLLIRNNYSSLIFPLNEQVIPAFEQRGFMVLNDEEGYTTEDYHRLIDMHQLAGANTFTLGLPGLYDGTNSTLHYKQHFEAAKGAMAYCGDVGMKFQLNVAGNYANPGFLYDADTFEPAELHYDADGVFSTDDPGKYLGTQAADGSPFLFFQGFACSLETVLGVSAHEMRLDTAQSTLFTEFADADAFLMVTTEGATDMGTQLRSDPNKWLFDEPFGRVDDYLTAAGSDAELIYWGWLHDVWYRWSLKDFDYSKMGNEGFKNDFEPNSYNRVRSLVSEWIQETGTFYEVAVPTIPLYGTVTGGLAGLGAAVPPQLTDPLGHGPLLAEEFNITAFLYWNHIESDPRNYFPRPAIEATVTDMRAALRVETDMEIQGLSGVETVTYPSWGSGGTGAKGVMGYRFWRPSRRFLNDYVVLRLASDRTLLNLDNAHLSLNDLNTVRETMVLELAQYISRGKPHLVPTVQSSLDDFDLARAPFRAVDCQKLEDALTVFNANNDDVDWWDPDAPLLGEYYRMLAFVHFTEKAALSSGENFIYPLTGSCATPNPDPMEYSRLLGVAYDAALQTPLLAEYTMGHRRIVGGSLDGLVRLLTRVPY